MDIEKIAKENTNFRKVLATGTHCQLVVMSLPIGGDIGEESHSDTDQLLFFVSGKGKAILNKKEREVEEHDVVFVPAGTVHNFVNTGDEDLKLYTVYAPPEHPEGTVHKTRQDADESSS